MCLITVDISYFWMFWTINIYRKVIRAWQILTEGLYIPPGDGSCSTRDVPKQAGLSSQGSAVSHLWLPLELLCAPCAVPWLSSLCGTAPRASSSATLTPDSLCWHLASPAQLRKSLGMTKWNQPRSRREHGREGRKRRHSRGGFPSVGHC